MNNNEQQENTTAEKKQPASKKKSSKKESNKDKIKGLETELAEAKDKYLRLYAEFDNYKKRTIKERLDLMSTAGREMISALLPIIDDFDRAKKSAEDESTNEVFSEGVSLVYDKLNKMLEAKGLNAMTTNGEVFDPELHDAISEIPAMGEELKGKIIDTIEKGYYLNDTIIRHAKVVVGK